MRQVGNLVTCGIASAARKAPNPVTFRWCSQHYDEVRQFFSRRGAYRRYKELLVRRDALERWYDFSNKSEAAALREWCAENRIDLSGTSPNHARHGGSCQPITLSVHAGMRFS
jgi:hypothetical protein